VTRYLTLDEVLRGAVAVLGPRPPVRDVGLLESALARPQTTVFGEDAYPSFHEKAAALLHSLVKNHPFVDGNKRMAFATVVAFAALNGFTTRPEDKRPWFDLVVGVASGDLDEVAVIAGKLSDLLAAA
jgi:death on curing protein